MRNRHPCRCNHYGLPAGSSSFLFQIAGDLYASFLHFFLLGLTRDKIVCLESPLFFFSLHDTFISTPSPPPSSRTSPNHSTSNPFMSSITADHIWGILTICVLLFSLFSKGWAERWPVVKWLWPRAWDERRASRREFTDGGSIALGSLKIDSLQLLAEVKETLSLGERLQSDLQKACNELLIRTKQLEDREERLKTEYQRQEDLLIRLEGVVATLKAEEDAPCSCCERHLS